jgi:putative adenylate-forming enzyme
MREYDHWTRAQLATYQKRQQRAVRQRAYAGSLFYRDHHKGFFDAPLSELPPLKKVDMMERYDEFVTDPSIRLDVLRRHLIELRGDQLLSGKYRLTATSGTTGQPGLFLYSSNEWLWVMASFWRSQELSGKKLDLTRRTRTASVGAIAPYYMTTRVAASLESWWTPELRLEATDSLERLAKALDRWKPEILASYPSVAAKLAEEQAAGRLNIAPKRIFTGGEPLSPQCRDQLEEAWGPCVYDLYAATEVGVVAAECEQHRGLHLMENLFIPEVVDASGRPVPDGETGEKLLITVFHRTTQPLIRYELSDCLRISPDPCPCGRPFRLVQLIRGKAEHFIRVAGRTGGTVTIHVSAVASVLERLLVRAWQVESERERLRLLLVGLPSDCNTSVVAQQLSAALSEQGAAAMQIEIKRVDEIPRGPSGKVVPVILQN